MKTGSGSEARLGSCRLFCRLLRVYGGGIGRGRSATSSNMISVPWMVVAASLFVAYSSYFVQAQFCQPLNATLFERCRTNKAGYNYTFISNNSDFKEVEELLSFIVRHEISNLDHCSTAADLLVCSINVPSCVEGKRGPMLPCRRLCEDLVHGCEESAEPLFYDELEWIKGMCQFLPNQTGDSGDCLEPAGFEPRYPAETVVQKCSPMVQTECSSLGYNLTTQGWSNMKGIKVLLDRHLKTMMGTDAVCAPLMKKIICTQLLPPCYPEEDGRPSLYTACQSDCEALLEKCPKIFQEQLGNLGYCMELGSASKTAHGFCKLTQWPAAGKWPNYVFQVPSTPPSTPVTRRTDAAPHPTHHVSNRTGPPPAPKAARSRSGHHVPLAAILVPAILVSVLMMIAASVIFCKRQKRSVTCGRVYRRQRNESDAVEM